MKIRTMRVNHRKNPLGYACEYPVFSWITEGTRGKWQKAAKVEIALDKEMKRMIYDSQWQKEIVSTGFCPNVQLSPRTRYYWRVKIRTEKRETLSSETAWFETGKMQELWAGDWITAEILPKEQEICFEKSFSVPASLYGARLYVSSPLGLRMQFNYRKLAEKSLPPLALQGVEGIESMTFDVTKLLIPGRENLLQVFLENPGKEDTPIPCFLAELRMETAEGKETLVISDQTWRQGNALAKRAEVSWGMPKDNQMPPVFWQPEKRQPCLGLRRMGFLHTSSPGLNEAIQKGVEQQKRQFFEWYIESDSGQGLLDTAGCYDREILLLYFRYLNPETGNRAQQLQRLGYGACTIPWHLYCFYGDEVLLAQQYALMQDAVENFYGKRFFSGESKVEEEQKRLIETAALYHCIVLTAKAAMVLGLGTDAQEYRKLAQKVKAVFRRAYLEEDGSFKYTDQTSLLLALSLKLTPKDGRQVLWDTLRNKIKEEGIRMPRALTETECLVSALFQYGQKQEVYELLQKTEFTKTRWLYHYLCGLKPAEIGGGFRCAILAPQPDRRLEYAECHYDSAVGRYISEWEWKKESIVFHIVIPFHARARFVLPFAGTHVSVNGKEDLLLLEKGSRVWGQGDYEIEVRFSKKQERR